MIIIRAKNMSLFKRKIFQLVLENMIIEKQIFVFKINLQPDACD